LSPEDFRKQVRAGKLLPAYLFLGTQDLLKAEAVDELARAAGRGSVRTFSGGSVDAGTLIEARQNLSLLDPVAVIVVRQAAKVKSASAELASALASVKEGPPIVFWDETVDRRVALFKQIADAKGEVEFATPRDAQLKAWVRSEAERLGHRTDGAAVDTLLELVGDDLLRLRSTLERLSIAVGDKAPFDTDAITLHIASSRSHAIFELQDAIYAKDAAASVRLYRRLLDEGEEVPGLVGVVFAAVRRLLLAREGGAASLMRLFEVTSPGRADRIAASARKFGVAALRRAIDRLADIDVESKTGRGDARAALEEWLLALAGSEAGPKPPTSRSLTVGATVLSGRDSGGP
jgi:DNA polymerase-3 subunit delta